jgi:hypothetical protein
MGDSVTPGPGRRGRRAGGRAGRRVRTEYPGRGSYAVGLEPSTHHVTGDAAARADGSMIWLTHGAARRYETVFRFLRN